MRGGDGTPGFGDACGRDGADALARGRIGDDNGFAAIGIDPLAIDKELFKLERRHIRLPIEFRVTPWPNARQH